VYTGNKKNLTSY